MLSLATLKRTPTEFSAYARVQLPGINRSSIQGVEVEGEDYQREASCSKYGGMSGGMSEDMRRNTKNSWDDRAISRSNPGPYAISRVGRSGL